jgi:hypothetical protein
MIDSLTCLKTNFVAVSERGTSLRWILSDQKFTTLLFYSKTVEQWAECKNHS